MVLEWSAIDGAKTYKVLYDEESLINPKTPEPILESPATDKTRIEIQKMMDGTPYYLVVQWLDDKGAKVGETLPLHASTLRNPVFALKASHTTDDQNIVLTFSYPIDLKNTQIEIMNTETKKPRTIKEIKLSETDLRVVHMQLEGKLAPNMSHDIVFKKVTNTSGTEMLPESRKTITIMFSPMIDTTQVPETSEKIVNAPELKETVPETSSVADSAPDIALDTLQKKTEELGIDKVEASVPLESDKDDKTPVEIDRLPQTGSPAFMSILLAILCWAFLSYKKKISL